MKIITEKIAGLAVAVAMSAIFISMLIVTVNASYPAPTWTVPRGNVQQRIHQLQQMFPHGSYFSADGKACDTFICVNNRCNNCRIDHIMSQNPQLRYAEPPDADIRGIFNQTWSCAAFARYAYFYIFGNPWNSYDPMTPPTRTRFIESKSLSDALPGDIIVWGDPHWAVYLGNNLFFHANIGATNMISYGTPYGGGRAPDRIYRAVNYDSINNTTVESYTITYYANGGSGAPESQTKYYLADLLLSDKVPVRSRYTFLGWSTYSTSANATYYRVPNQNIYEHVYTANRSNPMYAVWCKKGDVDRNGAVAIADVLEILKYLAKMDSAIRGVGFLSGDANGDGQVTIADALEILKYLAKMPSSLDN